MINLLIAIDGTESAGYSRRWIEEFYNSFDTPTEYKHYDAGPHTYSFGERNCFQIYNECLEWLAEAISRAYEKCYNTNWQERIVNSKKPGIFRNGVYIELEDNYQSKVDFMLGSIAHSNKFKELLEKWVRISIVGHSRGGHVAISLNNTLPFKVHFLGLLDPVDYDGSLNIDTSTITKENFVHIYHAVRSSQFAKFSAKSHEKLNVYYSTREYFGFDGLKNRTHTVKEYNTSHGGMGGSPLPNGDRYVKDDITCSEIYPEINQCYAVNEPIQQVTLNMINYDQNRKKEQIDDYFKVNGFEFKVKRIRKLNSDCMNESGRVRRDFFDKATSKDVGLPINDRFKPLIDQ